MALALLLRFLESQGAKVNLLPGFPKTGRSRGPRLDGWLEIDGKLAQVEVKNWGANAIGGKPHSGDPAIGWGQFLAWWKSTPGLRKVLHEMQPPASHTNKPIDLPIVCMWPVMHRRGEKACYFSVEADELMPQDFPSAFEELHIFSMSAYLRTLTEETLTLEMPKTFARLTKMKTILGICANLFSAK